MLIIKRTDSSEEDFISLVKLLDADLAIRDGSEHAFYNQFNSINHIQHVVVAYLEDEPVGCGAIKAFGVDAMEIKRMFVKPAFRGNSIATAIIEELESWTKELGLIQTVLETGKKQPEAIALYQKNGYIQIPNYGQYIGIENSLCFAKKLPSI
jgi:GNAT superfamily N-acetyltransferase